MSVFFLVFDGSLRYSPCFSSIFRVCSIVFRIFFVSSPNCLLSARQRFAFLLVFTLFFTGFTEVVVYSRSSFLSCGQVRSFSALFLRFSASFLRVFIMFSHTFSTCFHSSFRSFLCFHSCFLGQVRSFSSVFLRFS